MQNLKTTITTQVKNISLVILCLIGLLPNNIHAQCAPSIAISLVNPAGSRIAIDTGVDANGMVFNCAAGFAAAESTIRVDGQDFTKATLGISLNGNCEYRYDNSAYEAALPLTILYPISGTSCSYALSGALPVEISRFDAIAIDQVVALDWETATEVNNDYFEILRSNDGKNWESIEIINGAGTTNQTIRYQYLDKKPNNGLNYYVLKQVDFDGQSELSEIVLIEMKNEETQLEIFPNPTSESLNIRLQTNQDFPIEGRLYNAAGQVMDVFEIMNPQVVMNVADLQEGFYFLQIATDKEVVSQKFLKQ